MKLIITPKTLRIRDIVRAEKGFNGQEDVMDFMARFVFDDNDERVPFEQAKEWVYDLSVEELPGMMEQLESAVAGMQKSAVPLPTSAS